MGNVNALVARVIGGVSWIPNVKHTYEWAFVHSDLINKHHGHSFLFSSPLNNGQDEYYKECCGPSN